MREILFRGKRCNNGEWVEGDLVQDRDLETCMIVGHRYFTADCALQREEFGYDVDPATVGQWTGLTYKNGVKIFEGDILKETFRRINGEIECAIYEVKWNYYGCGFHLTHDDAHSEQRTHLTPHGLYEVIGNIYDKENTNG